MLVFKMTQDGTQIEKIEEWVDSAYSKVFLEKLFAHLEKKGTKASL